jgi:outer membrane lipoprotein-sorting protein
MGKLNWKRYLQGCALLMVLVVSALAQTVPSEADKAMQEGLAQMKSGNFTQAAAAYS